MTPQCQSLLHLPPLFPLICNTIKFTSHGDLLNYSANTSNSDELKPSEYTTATSQYLEHDHAGEHEGERDEGEGAEEVDEVAHEGEQRGDEDVEAEDEPPREEAARQVVPGEHALLQPLQPRVHGLVDRHREQLHTTANHTGAPVS
jgi:hypothetical protein